MPQAFDARIRQSSDVASERPDRNGWMKIGFAMPIMRSKTWTAIGTSPCWSSDDRTRSVGPTMRS